LLLLLLLLHSTQFDPGDPSIANDRDHAAIYLRPNTFLFRKLQTSSFQQLDFRKTIDCSLSLPLVEAQAESRPSCCFGGAVLESLGELLFRINLFQKSCEKQAGERFMSCMSFPIGLMSSGK
jgi:hypothetical protein